MVKFGEQLRSERNPGWASFYISYDSLKDHISFVEVGGAPRLRREAQHTAARHTRTTYA